MSEKLREIEFCPRCFASSEDGSWGCTVQGNYCENCSASGSVTIPVWAIKSIREQASWVGKRFYPDREDEEASTELRALRCLAPECKGRTARPIEDDLDRWWVTQEQGGGRSTSISVEASCESDALDKARPRLPYVPASALEEVPDA